MARASTIAMTIRLPAEMAEDLKLVADCDGETVIEAIRAAIDWYVSRRRLDPGFQEALKARIEHARRLLHEGEVA